MIEKLPDGWRVEKLGEAFIVKDGTHDSPKYVINDTTYPLITSKNIKDGKLSLEDCNYISKDDFDNINQRSIVHKNDIIMPMIGTIGNPLLILEEPHFAIKNVALFKPKNENPKFLLHYLKSNFMKQTFLMDSKGGTQKFVSLTYLRNLQIPIPPLPQQEKIVKVLDISSALIEKQKELIKNYDLFLKSKFIEMFGDQSSNKYNWKIKKFKDYIDYIGDIGSNGSNAVISKNIKMLDKKDYALMIRTTNLNKNDFSKDVKYVSEETYNFFKKSKIFGGEIIMNKIGSAGKFWIMPYLNRPVSLGLNQLVIRLKNLDTKYLFHLLSTDYQQIIINSKTNGAVTQSITKGAVKDIDIMIPPITLQNKFASIVEKIELIKEKENKKLTSLQTLHDSLMQKAFKGDIG